MTERSDESKKKKLKHVKVYDRIYELIQNGTYPAGSQLPSEPSLAEEMGVSRMTLRKALALFIEDGLVKNVPGVGHFVCTLNQKQSTKLDMSIYTNPIYAYCTEKTEDLEFEFRIEPPTRSILDTLDQYTPAVVIADRWYKKGDVPFSYTLSFLAIECIAKKQIDLTHPKELLTYLETICYQEMSSCRRILSHTTTGNFTAKRSISEHDSFILVQENISDTDGKILVSNKHYIPSELFRMEV